MSIEDASEEIGGMFGMNAEEVAALTTDMHGMIDSGRKMWIKNGSKEEDVELSAVHVICSRFFESMGVYDPHRRTLRMEQFRELTTNEYLDFLLEVQKDPEWEDVEQ